MSEQLLNGIVLGSIYALMGSGLTLVYGTMRVLNFAHGEFFMAGGYGVYVLTAVLGVGALVAVPLTIAAASFLAAAIAWLAVKPLMEKPGWEFSTIAATLGISIALQNIALATWGEKFQSVAYFVEGSITVGDATLPYQRLLIVIGAMAALGGTAALLKYTRMGWALRATAQDQEAARVMGVRTAWVSVLSFGVGGGLAALAACLLSPIYAVSPWMGAPLVLKAFAVVVMGGLGSFGGSIVAGLLLGIVESFGVGITSSEWREVISFGLLIAVIWIRPWGLFGTRRLQT